MPTTDTQVQELIINQLTEAEYNAALEAGTINENELYMVTDVQYPTMNDLNGYQPLINSSNKLSSSLVSGLSNVATSGDYNDLTNKPTLSNVATSGDYNDLTNKPSVVQSDWAETNSSAPAFILNKPTLANIATTGEYSDLVNAPVLASVATSGNYNDLTNKPTLSSVAISGEYSDLLNKPTLSSVATSGDYNDLTNKPTWTYNAQTETLTLG